MLTVTGRIGETLIIGGECIEVRLVKVEGNETQITIDAPADLVVTAQEHFTRVHAREVSSTK